MELNKDYNLQDSDYYSVLNNVVEEPHILLEGNEEKSNKRVLTLYGICMKCKQQRSHYQWCQSCERKQCEENFVNWISGNKEIDKFLQDTQLNSTKPQTFLEWIPFENLKNINILDTVLGNTRSTVYSAIWKEGPRVLWNQQNEKYERTETKVTIELYKDNNQIDKILNELKIYLDCHAQECALLFQFYGISKQPYSDDYFIVKQFTQNGSLADYISQNFNNLDWETKLHLLLYVAEDLKAIHNAGYIHRYLHPFSVLVFDNIGSSYDSSFSNFDDGWFCAIGEFSRCCKDLVLTNTEEIIGWQHYMAPEYLRYKTYTKASDVYAFGMIMHTVGTGYIPYYPLCIDHYLTHDIMEGLRPKLSHNIPKSFKSLIERCWNTEMNLRPSIHEIYNILLNLWSSINRNKCLNSLNSVSLEFLAADNIGYYKTKSQETLSQKIEYNKPKDIDLSDIINLEPSEMVNFIKKKNLVKFINKDELTTMKKIDSGHFGSISTAIWKKTDKLVVCKKIKNNESINKKQTEAFLHELDMHRRLDFCPRIIRVLGISFDLNVQEYWLIMEYADGGNLRQYLKQSFSKLTWDDKIRLSYQVTEGIKFLQGEKILHRDLHSGNIVIHQGEAKIIDLGIAKSTETETHLHSGVMGVIAYIDPKRLENYLYKYNDKSDIYSLGVLMWELSSGKPPFVDNESVNHLKLHLIDGLREEPVPDTPEEYLKLYKLCWDPDPDVRPPINEVFTKLGKMLGIQDTSYDDNVIDITKNSNNEQTNNNISSVISNDDFESLFIPDDLE